MHSLKNLVPKRPPKLRERQPWMHWRPRGYAPIWLRMCERQVCRGCYEGTVVWNGRSSRTYDHVGGSKLELSGSPSWRICPRRTGAVTCRPGRGERRPARSYLPEIISEGHPKVTLTNTHIDPPGRL